MREAKPDGTELVEQHTGHHPQSRLVVFYSLAMLDQGETFGLRKFG
jgi:hypothetical protein